MSNKKFKIKIQKTKINLPKITAAALIIGIFLIFVPKIVLAETVENEVNPGDINPGDVIINELMWMGSKTSTYDEWIELKNTTDRDIDVSGWQITKISSSQEVLMLEIPQGYTIAGHGFFIISSKNPENSILSYSDLVFSSVTPLSNSTLGISLYSGSWQDKEKFIDVAGDGKTPFAGQNSDPKSSMERNKNPGDGSEKESWHTATFSSGFIDQGIQESCTPGEENSTAYPLAQAGENLWGITGQEILFDASASSDPENDPLNFYWDFGDGQTGVGIKTSHVYRNSGIFNVGLTVSDGILVSLDEVEVVIYSGNLAIVQVYPNPPGADGEQEWIAIKNFGAEPVNLEGWAIKDGKGYSKKLTGIIEAGVTLKIEGISFLNNSGEETVYLVLPNGQIINQVSYLGPVSEDSIYSCDEKGTCGWILGQIAAIKTKAKATKKSSSSSTKSTAKPAISLASAALAADSAFNLGKDYRFIGENPSGISKSAKILTWLVISFSFIVLLLLIIYPTIRQYFARGP